MSQDESLNGSFIRMEEVEVYAVKWRTSEAEMRTTIVRTRVCEGHAPNKSTRDILPCLFWSIGQIVNWFERSRLSRRESEREGWEWDNELTYIFTA